MRNKPRQNTSPHNPEWGRCFVLITVQLQCNSFRFRLHLALITIHLGTRYEPSVTQRHTSSMGLPGMLGFVRAWHCSRFIRSITALIVGMLCRHRSNHLWWCHFSNDQPIAVLYSLGVPNSKRTSSIPLECQIASVPPPFPWSAK